KNTDEDGRTLFVLNVPIDATDAHLRSVFRSAGAIDSVKLNGKIIAPPVLRELVYSGSSAHIVFLESESVDRIVNGNCDLAAQGYKEFQDGSIPDTGISMWLAEYRSARPATELLQRDADTAIKAYNEAVAEQQRQLAEVAAEPDDDGFTLVTRRGTGGATKHGTVTDASGTTKKAKKKKELDNFYRFQVRESKREKLVQLRSKFEEDKKRIAALKESRKFKPF
ncbi:hypothetical protein GQ42DRAFT_103060, partial [Ramicandelaber brevisporus]